MISGRGSMVSAADFKFSHPRHAFRLSTVLDHSPFCAYTRNAYHVFPFSSFRSSQSLKTHSFDFSSFSDIFVPLCGQRFTSWHYNLRTDNVPHGRVMISNLYRICSCRKFSEFSYNVSIAMILDQIRGTIQYDCLSVANWHFTEMKYSI